ncbi:unnamed protein product [Ambrosiozyma monospora]|uniref:Unnamed protein product n=1 Tax=Ambrosiozyma monospora TaxID=43982 RepID=A0ACB5T7X3_AMBMO|nr:unnamed protein product [Ambrosiozyma monospora]
MRHSMLGDLDDDDQFLEDIRQLTKEEYPQFLSALEFHYNCHLKYIKKKKKKKEKNQVILLLKRCAWLLKLPHVLIKETTTTTTFEILSAPASALNRITAKRQAHGISKVCSCLNFDSNMNSSELKEEIDAAFEYFFSECEKFFKIVLFEGEYQKRLKITRYSWVPMKWKTSKMPFFQSYKWISRKIN